VTLAPGAGNTIRFEGSIADDSASSIGSASWSAGYGAAITIAGGGLVQFAGTNTYSGRTIIQGATLEATIGEGINSASTIFFNGSGTIGTLVPHVNAGVLLLSQDVTVRAGSLIPGQIMWNGAGGFAAGTADGITLSFGKTVGGSAQTLVWGSSYLASGSTLVFGSEYGQGRVTLTNNINLNGQVGQVVVYRNPGDVAGGANTAYLTGVMSNGGLIVGSAGYDGYLYITGQNALSSYTQNSGTVMTMAGNFGQAGVAPGRLMAPTGGAVTLNGGVLMLYAPEMMTTLTVNSGSGAQLYALAQVTATNVSNSGVISLLGGGQLTSLTNNAGATFATTGSLGVAGAISNAATATIYQGNIPVLYDQGVAAANAPVISASVVNNGTWVVYGGQSISTVTLSGNGTFTLVDAGGGLTLVQSGNSTWAGTMTGAGGFAKDGAGYLTLTGASTNTGGTAVLAGTLDTTGGGTLSDTGPVAVSAGAYLILGTLDTIGALTNAGTVTVNAAQTTGTIVNTGTITNNATLNSGAIANNAGGTFNMNANVTSGAVTNAAGATINLAANLNTGTNTLTNQGQINITGTPSITTGGLAGTTTAANINVASGAGLTLMQSGNTTYAGSITGAGSMRYSGPGTLTVLRNAGAPVSRINLTGGPLIVNSGTLALGTTSTNGANILAPTTALVVNGGSVVMVGVETITTANVASGASLASVDPLTATGAVTNAGTISLYSGGTLASLANNAGGTFTTAGAGLTVTGALVNAATATLYQGNNPTLVAASSPNTVSAITAGSITNNGAWSVYGTQTATTPTLTGTGNIALLTTGGGLTLVQSGTSTYAGTMSGAGSFSKSGAGVLTLTGASSNTGGTNVLAGTLSTAGGGTFAATDPISVSNGATLLLATAGTFGTLTNAGTVTMSAAQTTGAITNSGTITNTATLTSGTIANNANGTFNMNANVTSGAVTNAANATINLAANLNTGAGTLTNNGTINVSGNRTVTTAGLAGTANGGSVAIAAAGTLNLNQSGNTSYAGSITGAGSLVLNGAGTLTLTQNAGMGVGQVNLGGTITVNNGTLALNGNGILASNSQVVVNSGATTGTLQLVSGNQVISSLAGAGVINLGANQLTVANGGSFTGTVLGSGTVNVQNGAFSVNSSVSSTDPNSVFTVGGGAASTTTVAPGATLSFPTVSLTSNSTLVVSGGVTSNNVTMAPGSTMQVNAGSTVTSSGSTTLTGSSTLNNSGTLTSPTVNLTGSGGNAPTLHLGNGLAPTAPGAVLGNVVANTTNVNGGTLTGNGSVSVSGTTTITGQSNILQGTLAPGNSPGVMNFGNLILGNLSTSVMQVSGAVAGARVAGTDYDRVNITGTFQILPGAVMTIQKYDPTVEMARGETLKLFNFAAGQITGQFTSVTSTFTNDVIYSLGTGSVIGMGPAGYAGFLQRVGNTGNQRDILSQLMVNQTGGVKQFYGGALLDRVAAADALGQDTSVVFARFSPEAYIGLLENVKDALFNGGPGIMDDVSRETLGGSVSLSRRTRNSNSGGDYERLNMNGNGLRLGYSASHGQGIWKATVQLEEGNTNSSWLSNKTNGVQATLAGTYDLEGTQGVRLLGRLGLAHMDNNVTRTTNLGAARVPSVGADAMLGGIGLGHLTTVDGIKYRSSIELLSYSASVNGFVESNVSSATDALSVNRQSRSGMATVVDLGGSTRVVERVDIDLGLRYMNFGSKTNTVTANVVTETVPVTVRNPGLGNSQVSVNGGVSYALDKGESVVFGVSSFLNKGTYLNLTYNRAF
jgi:autotransporter-associated beta strand protein